MAAWLPRSCSAFQITHHTNGAYDRALDASLWGEDCQQTVPRKTASVHRTYADWCDPQTVRVDETAMTDCVSARVTCCLSKSVAVGRVHHRSEVLTGGIMLDTALLVVASFPFWNEQAFYIYQKSPSKTKLEIQDEP